MIRKILYIQYTNPAGYPPLEHSSRILARKGWQVFFLGTGSFQTDALGFPSHPNITARKLPFCRPGWKQKFHYFWFCLWVIGCAILWRPQWVYASDVLICPLGLLLSYFPGVKVIYHEHDSPSGTKESQWMHFCLKCRKKFAFRSARCVLPNQLRAENFQKEIGSNGNVISVWNCPTIEEVTQQRLNQKRQELKVLYQGSVVPVRLPITVLEALASLPANVSLTIIGYETIGHVGYMNQIGQMASDLGIREKISFLSPLPHAKLIQYCQNFDVGLALAPRSSKDFNEQTMTGASNKPFDYLASGLALLVSDLPEWKKIYVEPGYGLACNPGDSKSIAEALQWFLNHPKEMGEMGEQGRQHILSDWNYEKQFAPIIEKMDATRSPKKC